MNKKTSKPRFKKPPKIILSPTQLKVNYIKKDQYMKYDINEGNSPLQIARDRGLRKKAL